MQACHRSVATGRAGAGLGCSNAHTPLLRQPVTGVAPGESGRRSPVGPAGPGQLGDWWGEAEHWRERALADPRQLAPRVNRSHALWVADRPHQALVEARRALRLAPHHPLALLGLGNALMDLGRFRAADQAYAASLAGQDDPLVATNRARLGLGLERWSQAWQLAERRWQLPDRYPAHRPGPYWCGWPEAPTVQVWSEQGFGDSVQHLRWLVPLLRRGHRVVLELEPALVELARRGLAWAGGALTVVPRRAEAPPPLAPGACQGSLLSLPWLLGSRGPIWPARPHRPGGAGYLQLPPLAGLFPPGRCPRIGLVWASGPFLDRGVLERNYRRKSCLGPALQSLLNGLARRPIELVNLQAGPEGDQLPAWLGRFAASLPAGADFAETARWMAGLDLVISVDTAAAHLAGALGRPVWTLLPWAAEARWQRHRPDTPWYPSMRLIRQPHHNDWPGLIQRLLARLDLWLLERP